jgi:hypothetical protein
MRNDEEHTILIDSSEPGFRFRGQTLSEGALVEIASGAIYIVVEQAETDGLTRFVCEPL